MEVSEKYTLSYAANGLNICQQYAHIENALKKIVHRDYFLALSNKNARPIYRAAHRYHAHSNL